MRYVDTHECIQRLVHHKVGIVGPKQLHSYMQATHLVKIPSIAHVCKYIFLLCLFFFNPSCGSSASSLRGKQIKRIIKIMPTLNSCGALLILGPLFPIFCRYIYNNEDKAGRYACTSLVERNPEIRDCNFRSNH
jgi:hypothetical protein